VDTEAFLAGKGVHLEGEAKDYPPRWTDCEDIEVYDEHGTPMYAGPRYLRCARTECNHLVTHGMVRSGGCWCGNRKLIVPMRLSTEEKSLLKRGYYPLVRWEYEAIEPTLPTDKEPGWGKDQFKRRYGRA
jgi:hypothetical protein